MAQKYTKMGNIITCNAIFILKNCR